MQDSST